MEDTTHDEKTDIPPSAVEHADDRMSGTFEPDRSVPTTLWTYIAFVIANFGLCSVYGAVLQVLLATHVDVLAGPQNRVAQLAVVTGVGAFSSMIAQPVTGWIADRVHLPFGKRNIWIMIGAVFSLICLFPMAMSGSVTMLVITWAVCMWPLNMMQVNLAAFIPERTPENHRGFLSGVYAVSQFGGSAFGVVIMGYIDSLTVKYMIPGVICAVAGILYFFTTKDIRNTSAKVDSGKKRPTRAKGQRDVLFTARAHDFWLTFASRFCVLGSYYMITGYMIYTLQEYIHYGDGSMKAATAGMAVVTMVITVGNLTCSLIGGFISDRLGRIKIFVIGAALLWVIPALVMFFIPSWPALLFSCAIIGIGLGTYNSVDKALVARVLPSHETAARDLGVINFADAGPQTVAPTIAATIVMITHNYGFIFIAMGVFCSIGALIATRIRNAN
ncbi:MFS transporter [Bifidobacterium catulorum]|uniref:Major facilitator superfamily (MFS) profile domain-containing protein n=1 Tax=Bifidobacterium catulorum TaxID=1630173 RepID=A0A2U2MSY6_9BIFI|nr:MFS transporter [Bifidobacterium catulorum]PWG59963.1 hypothetical protein DF200_04775 [Bifidobacterium catulorum]